MYLPSRDQRPGEPGPRGRRGRRGRGGRADRAGDRLPAERAAALEQGALVFACCGSVYLEVRALAELAEIARDEGRATVAGNLWNQIDSRYGPSGPPAEDRERHPGD